ncbi:MAG TPA: ABC transporter [Propionibacteriaceae bacterium]|jgi:putative ABC transport system ATP-binding protein/lipoprotein-releasing system ATP-binding protein|nr:ABC transporter [Propionibacteriaceae bacterium]HBY22098.1 ABC transporter [Propionibacteriaceae bacterium]
MAELTIEELRFAYKRGQEEMFDGLSWRFERGAVTALTGPSGRGKSTLLFLIGLLLSPVSGRVMLDGEAVSQAPDARRAAIRAGRVGFMFQDAQLDPTRRVIDAVVEPGLYAGHAHAELVHKARALLDQFGLAARADHRPGQVSGGQAQRVALCRALVNSPEILLADEPTGNLDRHNAELVLDALMETARSGNTVVIATHDPFVLDRVDWRVTL